MARAAADEGDSRFPVVSDLGVCLAVGCEIEHLQSAAPQREAPARRIAIETKIGYHPDMPNEGPPVNDPSQPLVLFNQLIRTAFQQGFQRLESLGTPFQPLFIDDQNRLFGVDLQAGPDPIAAVKDLIRQHCPDTQRCAVIYDTELTSPEGETMDAIVVSACLRGTSEGVVWAQRYDNHPLEGLQRVGKPFFLDDAADFITEAVGG